MKKTFSISEAISFGWNTFKSNWKFWVVAFMLAMLSRSLSYQRTYTTTNGYKDENNVTPTIDHNNNGSELKSNTTRMLNLGKFEPSVLGVSSASENENSFWAKYFWLLIPFIVIAIVVSVPALILMVLVPVIFRMGYINLTLDAARKKDLYYKTLLNQVSFNKALRLVAAQVLAFLIILIGLIFFIVPGIIFALKYFFVSTILVDQDLKIGESLRKSSQLTKGVRFELLLLSFVFLLVSILGLLALGVGFLPALIVIYLADAYVYNQLLEQSGMQVDHKSTEIPLPPVTSGSLLAENLSVQDSLTVTE